MQSYVTVEEFKAHPTGLDVSKLVAGTPLPGQDVRDAELALLIQYASNALDQWCWQPLYAHTVNETKSVKPDQYGRLNIKTSQFPIRSVVSCQWRQYTTQSWFPVDVTKIDLLPTLDEGHRFLIGDRPYKALTDWGQPPMTVKSTYVAGYPNMALTAAANAGDTTIQVDTTLGVLEGDTVTMYDGLQQEMATVASVVDTQTLQLSASLQFPHSIGVRVSELPPVVSLSCILMTAYLIKERRAGSSLMMGGKISPQNVIEAEDMQLVREYMQPFRRVI